MSDFQELWNEKPWWKEGTTDKEMAEFYYKKGLEAKNQPSAQSPAAMAGSAANTATLKVKISGILMDAIGGHKEKYRTPEGFIKWGVVEGDINETIDAALR